METGRSTGEDPVFGQTGAANEVENTRYPVGPTNWSGNDLDAFVSRLGNLAGHNIGPHINEGIEERLSIPGCL